jgi:hypothetical protein
MKLTLHMVILMATGLTAIPAVSIAHGISGGHMSAVETHHNDYDRDRYRYSGAEQMATAEEQVQDYLLAVKKGRKHAAAHRYISVEALRPTRKQLDDYTKKQLPQPAEPSQLRCLMVFDTQGKQFVRSGC